MKHTGFIYQIGCEPVILLNTMMTWLICLKVLIGYRWFITLSKESLKWQEFYVHKHYNHIVELR